MIAIKESIFILCL